MVGLGLYLQNVLGLGVLQTSVVFMSLTLTFGLFAIIAGRWNDKYGIQKTTVVGLIMVALVSFAFSQLSLNSSLTYISIAMAIAGVGMALAFAALNSGVVKILDPADVGIGSSFFSMLALAGNFLGVTVTVYLYQAGGIALPMLINGLLTLVAVLCAMLMLTPPVAAELDESCA